MVIWVIKIFLCSSSVYFCHPFLITSAFVRFISFLFFIVPIFAWNVPLVFLIFLKRSIVFSILLFSLFLCIDHLGRLSYLSLLFFGSLHSDGYIFPFLLCLLLLFFSQLFIRPPQTTILPFCKMCMYYSNSFNISNWSIVDLQYCVSFCCIAK